MMFLQHLEVVQKQGHPKCQNGIQFNTEHLCTVVMLSTPNNRTFDGHMDQARFRMITNYTSATTSCKTANHEDPVTSDIRI